MQILKNNYLLKKENRYFLSETVILLSFIVIFFCIGITMSARLEPVWLDEVALTEPASNFYLYNSFTSSAWYHQLANEFHVSTSFLYTFLLALWMKLFGLNLVTVRLLNYVLMVVCSIFLWLAIYRLNLVNFSWLRIALIAMFLTSKGISFNYTSGRYDVICILLSLSVLLAYSIKNYQRRYLAISALGILFPLAGLSSVVYAILLFSILLIYNHRLFFKEFIAILIGFVFGMGFLYILYSTNKVWDDFINMSIGHSVVNNDSSQNLFTKLADKITKLFDKNDYICRGCLDNHTWQLLVIVLIFFLFYELLTKQWKFKSFTSFGMTTAILIPTTMCLLGKYPIYYSWMSVIPLVICICGSFNQILANSHNFWTKQLFSLVFLLVWLQAMFYGLPSAINKARYNWDSLDYAKVDNFIAKNINQDDIVYSDFPAFYAIKPRVKQVFFPLYFGLLTNEDKDKMSVIVIDPRESVRAPWNPGVSEIVGDDKEQWYDTEENLDTGSYKLRVYRKKTDNKKTP